MSIKELLIGFKVRIKNKLLTMCGIPTMKAKVEEEIDTIYYILNNGLDITKFPKASGELRKYQLADVELLRLFHEACQKHQLTYWLDWGTLLGAIRHNGFIPWDDDLDVCMPRADFDKAKTILTEEFAKIGFSFMVKKPIYIWDEKSGISLDIFAVDNTGYDGNNASLEQKAKEFLTICFRKTESHDDSESVDLDDLRDQIMGGIGERTIFYSALETTGRLCKYSQEDIFPLRKHAFEQYEFMVPNNYAAYLLIQYPDYMSFPRNGILHHVRHGIPTYMRASQNNVNLDDITERLSEICLL